jgi:hypothetical protein
MQKGLESISSKREGSQRRQEERKDGREGNMELEIQKLNFKFLLV